MYFNDVQMEESKKNNSDSESESKSESESCSGDNSDQNVNNNSEDEYSSDILQSKNNLNKESLRNNYNRSLEGFFGISNENT